MEESIGLATWIAGCDVSMWESAYGDVRLSETDKKENAMLSPESVLIQISARRTHESRADSPLRGREGL